MKVWKDNRHGINGTQVWLLYPAVPVLLAAILFFVFVLATEDFEDAYDVFVLLLFIAVWLIDRMLIAVISIPKVKQQIVNLELFKNELNIQCYLNQKFSLTKNALLDLKKCAFGFWYLRYSYLSDKKTNYYLKTKGGQKFYISGDMPEVDSLIATLQEIIESNRNP